MMINRYLTIGPKLIAHADHPHMYGDSPESLEVSVPEREEQSTEMMTSPPSTADSTSDLPTFDSTETCSIESCTHSSDPSETDETGTVLEANSFPRLMENLPAPPAETLLGVIVAAPFALYALRRRLKS